MRKGCGEIAPLALGISCGYGGARWRIPRRRSLVVRLRAARLDRLQCRGFERFGGAHGVERLAHGVLPRLPAALVPCRSGTHRADVIRFAHRRSSLNVALPREIQVYTVFTGAESISAISGAVYPSQRDRYSGVRGGSSSPRIASTTSP